MAKKSGRKSPQEQFAESINAFGAAFGALPDSELKTQLMGKLPHLQPTGVRNELEGSVTGTVVQVGSQLGGEWKEAGELVGKLGDAELARTFLLAATAAAACATTQNSIKGTVTGVVIQAGDVKGGLNFNDWR